MSTTSATSAKTNQLNKQSNLGSTTNLSTIRTSNSFPSTARSDHHESRARSFGLQSRYSLSKSNLLNNNGSTSNLNRSHLNLNSHLNTLPSLIKPTGSKSSSNQHANLGGSTTQLDTNKRSLMKPKSLTATTSCLPAPKSRPTSAYLPADALASSKSRSKLPNTNASRTASNLNLNEQASSNLVKPLNKIRTSSVSKDGFNLKSLNKKPQTSSSIKTAVQHLSQSSSNSMIYKPYSSLNNRSRPRLTAKENATKINLNDEENNDKTTIKNSIKKPTGQCRSPDKSSVDKCNIARVSPIRRPFSMSNNVKRQLNGSLNSSDQDEDELDDDLFDNSTLNQPTTDDTSSFNLEDAKYYAVLSSSDDDKLSNGPRRSREREERRLRRASGQRSSSSKCASPTSASNIQTVCKNNASTSESNEKLNHLKDTNSHPDDSNSTQQPTTTTTTTTPNKQSKHRSSSTNLNASNSSSINTIDHKCSLNTMFPTLNRLHNSNSVQQLNSPAFGTAAGVGNGKSANDSSNTKSGKIDEQDYQSDDAETTLYKLKSLDFNCNSSTTTGYATKSNNKESSLRSNTEKDGNNNSLYNGGSTVGGQSTNQSNDNSQTINEPSSFTTPELNSLLTNYMSRSIGSLTGSLNGLNSSNLNGGLNPLNSNWSNHKTCSTPPPMLSNFTRSKSPNVYQSFLNATAPSSFQSPQFSFLPSPTPLQSSTTNTVINNVQNTTVLNSVPSSFTSRLSKCGENRGSSLSLLSACSSNYSNNLSITLTQANSPHYAQQNEQRLFLDKSTLNEIKHLKNELNRANEKINLLKSQLVTSGQMVNSFEQSLQSKTSRMKHYVLQLEEKDREIEHLKTIVDNLKKTYGLNTLDLEYRSNANSPVLNQHNSRSQANSSDSESVILKTNKSKHNGKKTSKKRSDSKKSRANSANANSTDDEDTASLASLHSKDGTLNGSSGWFKSSITRAFKKKSHRSKSGSNQELDKAVGDFNDIKHPQHPSQLHQSYIQQDKFKDSELLELKAQLIEKEKSLTDERLKGLSREDEMMKLKECLNCLQQELFGLKQCAAV